MLMAHSFTVTPTTKDVLEQLEDIIIIMILKSWKNTFHLEL